MSGVQVFVGCRGVWGVRVYVLLTICTYVWGCRGVCWCDGFGTTNDLSLCVGVCVWGVRVWVQLTVCPYVWVCVGFVWVV